MNRLPLRLRKRTGPLAFGLLTLALLMPGAGAGARAQTVPRAEHPRPDLARAGWQTLNSRWEFEFDDADRGLAERYKILEADPDEFKRIFEQR